jgi:hypothetical protein
VLRGESIGGGDQPRTELDHQLIIVSILNCSATFIFLSIAGVAVETIKRLHNKQRPILLFDICRIV